MATVTLVENGVAGDLKYAIADYLGPASYVTGGDPLTAANLQALGFPEGVTIFSVTVTHSTATTTTLRLFTYVPSTKTIMIYTDIDTITQAGNGTDQSAVGARLLILGR